MCLTCLNSSSQVYQGVFSYTVYHGERAVDIPPKHEERAFRVHCTQQTTATPTGAIVLTFNFQMAYVLTVNLKKLFCLQPRMKRQAQSVVTKEGRFCGKYVRFNKMGSTVKSYPVAGNLPVTCNSNLLYNSTIRTLQ